MTVSRIVGEGNRDSEKLHRRAKSGHPVIADKRANNRR